jgi:hypothetical protein
VGQSWTYDSNGDVTDYYDGVGNRTHTVYQTGQWLTPFPQYVYEGYGTSLQRVTTSTYDYWSSLPTAVTDYNGLTRSFTYDYLGRQTQLKESDSSGLLRETSTFYNDRNRRVIGEADLAAPGDQALVSVTDYDQLGRTRLTRQLENASQSADNDGDGIKVQTRYSAGQLGVAGTNYQLVSNPYRAATSGAETSASMGWTLTTNKNDWGERSVTTSSFAGSGQPAPFGSNVTTTGSSKTKYSINSSPLGLASTITDQGNKSRTMVIDGLGRIEQATEDGISAADSPEIDHRSQLIPITILLVSDQRGRSEATLAF